MAVIKLIDSATSELVSYESTTTWADGTAMDDSKVDGVIYRKKGNIYYKRAFTGSVNVEWFGAKHDGVTDDTVAIQATCNFISKATGTIVFPAGIYICQSINNS